MIDPLSIQSPLEDHSLLSEPRCGLYRRTGNCVCFLISRSGHCWISLGPDCPFSLCLLTIMLGFAWIFRVLMAPFVSAAICTLGTVVIGSVIGFYMLTVLKDAGIEPRNVYLPASELCPKCGAELSPRTYHCNTCDVCIKGYDHHCPLTGKCIGEGNIRCFYSFLISLFLFVGYGVLWGLTSTSPTA